MKKRKKIMMMILIIILIGILVLLILLGKNTSVETTPLLEIDEYKKIELEHITQINVLKTTIGGQESILKDQSSDIKKTYNYLSSIKIGSEVTKSCDDNGTTYIITLDSGEEVIIEIECNWLVMNNKRYSIVK